MKRLWYILESFVDNNSDAQEECADKGDKHSIQSAVTQTSTVGNRETQDSEEIRQPDRKLFAEFHLCFGYKSSLVLFNIIMNNIAQHYRKPFESELISYFKKQILSPELELEHFKKKPQMYWEFLHYPHGSRIIIKDDTRTFYEAYLDDVKILEFTLERFKLLLTDKIKVLLLESLMTNNEVYKARCVLVLHYCKDIKISDAKKQSLFTEAFSRREEEIVTFLLDEGLQVDGNTLPWSWGHDQIFKVFADRKLVSSAHRDEPLLPDDSQEGHAHRRKSI